MNYYKKYLKSKQKYLLSIQQTGGSSLLQQEYTNAIITKLTSNILLKKFGRKTLKVYERWLLSNYNSFDKDDVDKKLVDELVDNNIPKNDAIFILDIIKKQQNNLQSKPKINNKKKYIIIKDKKNKLQILKTDRIKFLINKFGQHNTLISCLRYISIMPYSGQQLAVPQSHYNLLYSNYNVRNEGFASPFNSKLIEKSFGKYCSLFGNSIDSQLGSIGSFFDIDLTKIDGNWMCNPPFFEFILEKMADHIIKFTPLAIYIVLPNWQDNIGIKKLLNIAIGNKVIIKPIFEQSSDFSDNVKIVNGNFSILYLAIGINASVDVLDKYPQYE